MSGAIALKAPDPAILSRRDQIIADLADFLPAGTVVSSERELKPFETDGFIAYRRMPLAVTLPRSTEEVAAILKYCARYKVPVVARGAGTSLSGGAIPQEDAVVIALTRMNRILEVDYPNRCARVQAGVTNLAISDAVSADGFFYAPDPSSQLACTIGGNIANGSPIGDSPPALIALSATVTLRSASGQRTMPLEDYFIDYGKQDRQPGEFVESILVPRPKAESHVAVYKITKRRDEDISALCGAFHLETDVAGIVTHIRIAFGGMAGTPKRARSVEAALYGKPFTQGAVDAARDAFDHDYQPLTDWRATAEYRQLTAKNLLTRFFLEVSGTPQELQRFATEEA